MDRAGKSETIEELKGVFANAGAVVVTHYMGMTVANMSDLRQRLRQEGATLPGGQEHPRPEGAERRRRPDGSDLFKGPVAIAYGPDAVSAAKVSTQYAKDNEKFIIIGGLMGAQVLDAKGIDTLAKLPSLDELRARLVGLISTPATRIAGVLQAPAGQLARVFNAYATKDAA